MVKMSKKAAEIYEEDGLEFAQRKEKGEDIKIGDGKKILELRAEKEIEEKKIEAVLKKDELRGIPEIPKLQDLKSFDFSKMFGRR
mmetsp:Transcript_54775/g.46125  ORF Transcript_54775/g.46125 Transcript_54775/m.46125 type:complete len:85 (+) Transcript_54775:3733-3987(+)